MVHASVFRFEGQLTVFEPYDGPCYRCLYPTPPPPELAPGCSVAGVLGVVPGIMGLLQANEVLKVLLGIGEPLVGRLLLFDALDGSFTELQLRRDPTCPICSDAAVAARAAGTPSPPPVGSDQPFALGAPVGATSIGRGCPMSTVRIPPVLRAPAGGEAARGRRGDGRRGARRPDRRAIRRLATQLLTPDGDLNRFVNVYVNGRDVRYLGGSSPRRSRRATRSACCRRWRAADGRPSGSQRRRSASGRARSTTARV